MMMAPVGTGWEQQRRRCLDIAGRLLILAFTESEPLFLEREATFWQQWWSWAPPRATGERLARLVDAARPVVGSHPHEGDRRRYLGLARRMEGLALAEPEATFEPNQGAVWRDLMQLGIDRGVVRALEDR